jgi:hypothetical protein
MALRALAGDPPLGGRCAPLAAAFSARRGAPVRRKINPIGCDFPHTDLCPT